jgi:hemerythrin-like domain-containing protein
MATPTDVLKDEHSGIQVMLSILEKVSDRLEAGGEVDPRHLEEILEFLQVFVDTCHHAKEEEYLFPEMARAGIPWDGGPIAVMLADHKEGRRYVRGMGAAAASLGRGDAGAASRFAENAREYVALLRAHIEKEDTILYPIADARISEGRQRALLETFERVEEERIGHGRHEAFHRMIDRLRDIYLA